MWGDIGPVDRPLQSTSVKQYDGTRVGAIATVVAIAFALLCLRAVLAGPWLLLDADLGWHLGYGEWIATNLVLPKVDQWSFTKWGADYQLTQWGGEVLLGLANMSGGSPGLLILNCMAVAATLGVMFATAARLVSGWLAAIVVGVSGFMLFAGAVRPTMFSWLLAALLILICVSATTTCRRWTIAASAVLIALWTNIHGSFALATVAAAAFWSCMALQRIREDRAAKAVECVIGVMVICAATLLNPYGWKVWEAVYKVATLETTQSRYFSDWKAPEIMSGLALPAWLAAGALLTAAYRRQSAWVMVACLGVICLSLSAQRNAGLATVGACAVLCLALSGSWLDKRLAKEARGWRPRGIAWHVGVTVTCIGSAAWLATGLPQERVQMAQKSLFPLGCQQGLTAAAEDLRTTGAQRGKIRLLNEFEHGGWWMRSGAPVLTAIDGRADLFGDEAFKNLETIKRAGDGWRQILMDMGPDAVCLAKTAALFLEPNFQRDFELASADQTWDLWVRRRPSVEPGRDSDRD